MNHKAFTLIELLVVVAIIGILAAVGVVAYNGYTTSAKKNATKSNLNSVYKYLSGEIMKCELGDDKIFNGAQNCSSNTSGSSARATADVNNQTSGLEVGDKVTDPEVLAAIEEEREIGRTGQISTVDPSTTEITNRPLTQAEQEEREAARNSLEID